MTTPGVPPSGPTRRRLLAGAAGAGLAALGATPALRGLASATALPPPEASGIRHVVVLMMENRSFDHFLGWMPGADGRQAGLAYPDRTGVRRPTHHLTDRQGCGHPDPDHSYDGARVEYDGGRCDGWLRAGENDEYAIGYYTAADLPFLAKAAPAWTTLDRYFSALLGPTYPNRIYQHAAVTDRLDNATTTSTLPTIWDRLATAGLSGRYYYGDIPFLALWGAKYIPISRPYGTFLADCAAGTLPEVSFVDPRFGGEEQGLSNDDHPHADIMSGEALMAEVYRAVTSSPAWPNTVLVINYDEWGGFFEHVPPGLAPDVRPELRRRGFRVPALVVSPFARRRHVGHTVYDHTSVLRMIEWRWRLAPLSLRDAQAANLADVLDLRRPRLDAPPIPVAPFVSTPCAPGAPAVGETEWTELLAMARASGWPV